MTTEQRGKFLSELRSLLNRHSIDNEFKTPDFLLTEYLDGCLNNLAMAISTGPGEVIDYGPIMKLVKDTIKKRDKKNTLEQFSDRLINAIDKQVENASAEAIKIMQDNLTSSVDLFYNVLGYLSCAPDTESRNNLQALVSEQITRLQHGKGFKSFQTRCGTAFVAEKNDSSCAVSSSSPLLNAVTNQITNEKIDKERLLSVLKSASDVVIERATKALSPAEQAGLAGALVKIYRHYLDTK